VCNFAYENDERMFKNKVPWACCLHLLMSEITNDKALRGPFRNFLLNKCLLVHLVVILV